jgi:Tol biopolymer transport system component
MARHLIQWGIYLIACCLVAGPQQSGNELLQQALVKERAEGDLKEAIAIYKQIVERHAANRPLAAKALFQMAHCYERLGHADARQTYQRLIRDYSDQSDVVAEARRHLASISPAEPQPKFTKIRVPTKLPRMTVFALSPDGQQLAYVSRGSVWLIPVHGASDPTIAGAPRRITEPIEDWSTAIEVAWSQDSKWLLLHLWEGGRAGGHAVYVVRSTGGTPLRVPLGMKTQVHSYLDGYMSLSPDGKQLAYTAWPEGEEPWQRSIYLVPTTGGQPTQLTESPTAAPAFSPDGSRIAYFRLRKAAAPSRGRAYQLWVTSISGDDPVMTYELDGPGRLHSFTWASDGRTIAVLLNRSQRTDMCDKVLLLSLDRNGRPAEKPTELDLREATGHPLAGWGTDNKIGLIFSSPGVTALYTVPAAGGKAIQLTPKYASMPSWTPDGKEIYFDGAHHGRGASIEVVPADGGEVKRIPLRGPQPLSPSYPTGGLSVSPDGRSVLFRGHFTGPDADGLTHIFMVPTDGGDVTELTTGVYWAQNPCWSPDGSSIAFIGYEKREGGKRLPNIFAMPLGGQARRLTSFADKVVNARIAWSPSGEHIAFYSEDEKVKLAPASGGPVKVLVDGVTGYRRHAGLAWSPDGAELAYTVDGRIWQVSLTSGSREELETELDAVHTQIAWSPDGKKIAFSAIQGGEPELWLMEDFLPLAQAGH